MKLFYSKHGVLELEVGKLGVGGEDLVLDVGSWWFEGGSLKLKYKIIGLKRPRFEVKTLPL